MLQVLRDRQSLYRNKSLLVETFVEQGCFTGCSYRATNWIHAGMTAGRDRQDTRHQAALSPKEIYVYPLHRMWQEFLGGSLKEETFHQGNLLKRNGAMPLWEIPVLFSVLLRWVAIGMLIPGLISQKPAAVGPRSRPLIVFSIRKGLPYRNLWHPILRPRPNVLANEKLREPF